MKYFIITIDTEGDNLWDYRPGDLISTKNAQYIPRFQKLCNIYDFKPVYFTNYEMANDDFFVDFISSELKNNTCEIGFHLHAWNTPPDYELLADETGYGQPYLIEYPVSIMRQKIKTLHNLLREKFNMDLISHRSGRWAMNQDYFNLLLDYKLKIDCSVTPHISWEKSRGFSAGSKGSDYTDFPEDPYIVKHSSPDIFNTKKTLLEIPVTIKNLHILPRHNIFHIRLFLSDMKSFLRGKTVWLRPNGCNLPDMLALIHHIQKSDSDYLMFMLHSSELMPGGSPTFKTKESIESLYADLEILFETVAGNFKGITLKNYYELASPSIGLSA
jgi:hypothetical protein